MYKGDLDGTHFKNGGAGWVGSAPRKIAWGVPQ